MKKLLFVAFTISLLFGALLANNPFEAWAGGNLYLSPAGQTLYQGSSVYVSVRVNTGGSSADAVQANLSYPADKLDYLGISYSGSAFEIQAESSGGSGSIRIGRGTLSAKSGDNLIATITFRAKVSSGTATVSFTSGSEAVRGGSVVTSATSSATYTLAPTPPPLKEKPKDKTAPKISGVKVVDVGLNKATVTWKTNEKATSMVEYGPSKNLGITASSAKLISYHQITLSSKLLFPGTTYYYQVKSKDAAGNETNSKLTSFKTKGYTIRLKITGSDGKPLLGVKVKIVPGMEEVTTDENGEAIFTDVAPGEHSAQISVDGQVLASAITVDEATKPEETQEFTVRIAGAATTKSAQVLNFVYLAIIAGLAILSAALIWRIRKHSRRISQKKPQQNVKVSTDDTK